MWIIWGDPDQVRDLELDSKTESDTDVDSEWLISCVRRMRVTDGLIYLQRRQSLLQSTILTHWNSFKDMKINRQNLTKIIPLSTGASTFVTPPDRIRHDPLRMLMQQLQNDEQGMSAADSDIYNVLMNTAPGDVASILLGGDGTLAGGGDSYNFTITNGTPGTGRRIGTIRPAETQGDPSSLSDLLPGGVDRALQFRRFGVQHPLLSVADDGSAAAAGRSRIAMLVHQSNPHQTSNVVQLLGRPQNAPPSSQINAHFAFGLPSRGISDAFEEEMAQGREGIDLRVGADLSRILMDETDSIVSAAMAHMPGGRLEATPGGRVNMALDADPRYHFDPRGLTDPRGRNAGRGGAAQAPLPSEVPIAVELLQRHLRDLLVQRLAVNEELSPVPALTPNLPITSSHTGSGSEDGPLNLPADGIPEVTPSGAAEEQTDQEVLREIRRSDSESPTSTNRNTDALNDTSFLGDDTDADPVTSDPVPAAVPTAGAVEDQAPVPTSNLGNLDALDLTLIIDTIRGNSAASSGGSEVPVNVAVQSGLIESPQHSDMDLGTNLELNSMGESRQVESHSPSAISEVSASSASFSSALTQIIPDQGSADLEILSLVDPPEVPALDPLAPGDSDATGGAIPTQTGEALEAGESAEAGEAETVHAIPCPSGYEPDVFYSLPDFMQREIADQHEEEGTAEQMRVLIEVSEQRAEESLKPTLLTSSSLRFLSLSHISSLPLSLSFSLLQSIGYDYDTFTNLPESIRQEILDQARRDQVGGSIPADPTNSQEMDNTSFLVSLSPELRAEVLLTADAAFIATLPPELVAEAQMHRERAAAHWQQRELQQPR
jgi:Ubiquitin binding region